MNTPEGPAHELSDEELLPLMVASERRNRQRRRGHAVLLYPEPPCTVCGGTPQKQWVRPVSELDPDVRLVVNDPCGHRMTYTLAAAERLVDQVQHLVDQDENRPAGQAVEEAGLDKSRRYLRPVQATIISDDPAGVHLAVYSWLPVFDAWATGPGLCGESMRQGPLPDGTEVTCSRCLERQPKYERMLAPGYRPEDDDPEALRAKLERIRADMRAMCECCLGNRERMARINHELGIDVEGLR